MTQPQPQQPQQAITESGSGTGRKEVVLNPLEAYLRTRAQRAEDDCISMAIQMRELMHQKVELEVKLQKLLQQAQPVAKGE